MTHKILMEMLLKSFDEIFELEEAIEQLSRDIQNKPMLSSCCRLKKSPIDDCVDIFDGLFEMVLDVSDNTAYDALAIVGHMLAEYDIDRIRYAVNAGWPIWDLDRWEVTMRAIDKNPLSVILRLSDYGYVYNEKGVETIAKDGANFMRILNKPLANIGVDIEILLEDLQRSAD